MSKLIIMIVMTIVVYILLNNICSYFLKHMAVMQVEKLLSMEDNERR